QARALRGQTLSASPSVPVPLLVSASSGAANSQQIEDDLICNGCVNAGDIATQRSKSGFAIELRYDESLYFESLDCSGTPRLMKGALTTLHDSYVSQTSETPQDLRPWRAWRPGTRGALILA